jgi:hypothetical protein
MSGEFRFRMVLTAGLWTAIRQRGIRKQIVETWQLRS